MECPVRLNTSARAIASAIDEVLDEDVWLDALSDDDFENDVVISLVNDDFVIEVCTAAAEKLVDASTRAITQPAKPTPAIETYEPGQDYDAWYAAYLQGGRPEAFPRSRAPRATSTMALPVVRSDRTETDD